MTAPVAPPKPSLGALVVRRTAIAIVLTVLVLAPAVVLFMITKQPSATYAAMATLIGIVAVMAGGPRIGVIAAIVAGLTPFTGAALMALGSSVSAQNHPRG